MAERVYALQCRIASMQASRTVVPVVYAIDHLLQVYKTATWLLNNLNYPCVDNMGHVKSLIET